MLCSNSDNAPVDEACGDDAKESANTHIVASVMGRGRTSRAPELVTSLVLNPARADPEAAILAKTTMDVRRVLRKCPSGRKLFANRISILAHADRETK